MKKTLFFLCAIFAWNLSAQEQVDFDARLLYRYDKVQLGGFAQNNISKLNYLNFFVENAFIVEDISWIPEEKKSQLTNLLTLLKEDNPLAEDITSKDLNIFMFDVRFENDKRTSYRLGNSNTLIVLRSMNEIYDLFNQSNIR
jgi:hypothetical protein